MKKQLVVQEMCTAGTNGRGLMAIPLYTQATEGPSQCVQPANMAQPRPIQAKRPARSRALLHNAHVHFSEGQYSSIVSQSAPENFSKAP